MSSYFTVVIKGRKVEPRFVLERGYGDLNRVKKQIREHTGIPESEQEFVGHNDDSLSSLLSDYFCTKLELSLKPLLPKKEHFGVLIGPDPKRYKVTPSLLVKELKEMICQRRKEPLDLPYYQLSFKDTILDDNTSLDEYYLHDRCVLEFEILNSSGPED